MTLWLASLLRPAGLSARPRSLASAGGRWRPRSSSRSAWSRCRRLASRSPRWRTPYPAASSLRGALDRLGDLPANPGRRRGGCGAAARGVHARRGAQSIVLTDADLSIEILSRARSCFSASLSAIPGRTARPRSARRRGPSKRGRPASRATGVLIDESASTATRGLSRRPRARSDRDPSLDRRSSRAGRRACSSWR